MHDVVVHQCALAPSTHSPLLLGIGRATVTLCGILGRLKCLEFTHDLVDGRSCHRVLGPALLHDDDEAVQDGVGLACFQHFLSSVHVSSGGGSVVEVSSDRVVGGEWSYRHGDV